MKKYLIGIFILCLLLQGCEDTRDKAQDFVNEYNAAASTISTRDLQSTIAELKPDNTIHIVMVSRIRKNEANTVMFDLVMPAVMSDMLGEMPSFQELIDEGVKFNVEYKAADNSVLAETTIDKVSLNNHSSKKDSKVNGTSNEKRKELLMVLNKSLPIEYNESGTRIISVDVKGDDLLLDIEVSDKFRELFQKDDSFVAALKKDLMADGRIKSMLKSAWQYGVRCVRCEYTTLQKVTIGEIVINQKDFSGIE